MPSTFTAMSDYTANQQITDTDINYVIHNDDFLRNPPEASYSPSTGAANITTSSATMVDLTSFTVTLTSQGRMLYVLFAARANGTTARFDILLDGISVTGDNDGVGAPGATGEVSVIRLLTASAGSHTVKIQWRSTSGTVTVYPAGLCQLYVREW